MAASSRQVPLSLAGWIVAVAGLALLVGLVSLHEKHYAKRRLFLIQKRVEALEQLVTEDRFL